MAKSINTEVLDGALNVIKNTCTRMVVCSTQPTTYTEANATYALADQTMVTGDFTLAGGDVSGRKVTVAAKANILIDASGSAQHIALLDVSGTRLLGVTTCTTAPLTANGSNTVSVPTFDFELNNPA